MTETSTSKKYYYGTGRRKTAVARVRIYEGLKESTLNDKPYIFTEEISTPFELTGKKDAFGATIKVNGGGWSAQIEAITHGISRALVSYNPEFRSTLKKAGFLKRDPREVERKKPGLKKARRAPQWSKR